MLIKKLLAICNVLTILAMFLVVAIYFPTFSMNFYQSEYSKYNIPERIGVSEDQLMGVTKRLTDYMRGYADDLVITAEVNGVIREFFDDRDKAHMADVKRLFDFARVAFVTSLCVAIFTWLMLREDRMLLFRVSQLTLLCIFGIFAALAGVIALNFDSAFITFHLIFFDNDLWVLDPAKSLLINIVPQEFFVDIAIRVGLIFGGLMIAYALLLSGFKWKCR